MIPWRHVGTATVPGSRDELALHARGDEWSIRVGGQELMNSRRHGSEDALGTLPGRTLGGREDARVLVGGLGMGFTVGAALSVLGPDARVVVAELVPEIVEWNRTHLAHLAGRPLDDPRATVVVGDVGAVLRATDAGFDAILLDVDNGPEGLTRPGNDSLYGRAGLAAAKRALRPRGVFAVWSARPDPAFAARLARAGFDVHEERVRAHGGAKPGGAKHTLFVGTRRRP